MDYISIQNEIIARYRIDICDGTKCKQDWKRTHAHIRERRVCKWKRENTKGSTLTLLHEVGHIVNNKGRLRRAEQEYFATTWAIDRCNEFGIKIPVKFLFIYQRYILLEKARGERRGGAKLGELNLYKYAGLDVTEEEVLSQCSPKWKDFINGKI